MFHTDGPVPDKERDYAKTARQIYNSLFLVYLFFRVHTFYYSRHRRRRVPGPANNHVHIHGAGRLCGYLQQVHLGCG